MSSSRSKAAVEASRPLGPQAAAVVQRLHAQSDRQFLAGATRFILAAIMNRLRGDKTDFTITSVGKKLLSDKLVALDPEKAALCYLLCRSLNARRVVEAGTSFGVSTIYLACALRDNAHAGGAAPHDGHGTVIGTEHEPSKAAAAREHFAQAGVSDWIDLREGDLRETLQHVEGSIDFMLVDIWIPMALPALRLVAPRMRSGAIVLCDNTVQFAKRYADYLSFVRDPANGFRSISLPMKGGMEMSVRVDGGGGGA
jgi:predicted O-methyltransferase YrrM